MVVKGSNLARVLTAWSIWAIAASASTSGADVWPASTAPAPKDDRAAQHHRDSFATVDGSGEISGKLMRTSSSKISSAKAGALDDAGGTSDSACAGIEEVKSRIRSLRSVEAAVAAEVQELEGMVQDANFALGDGRSRTTLQRQYSEPACLCRDEAMANTSLHSEGSGFSSTPLMDMTCANLGATFQSPVCREGFPFFRMTSNALDMDMCFQFCLGMGLDVFAIVDRTECRCGASAGNVGAWGARTPLKALLPPDLEAAPAWTSQCHIKAAKYLGLVDGRTPANVLASTDIEQKYIRSIMLQKDIRSEDDAPDVRGNATGFMLVESGDGTGRFINERCTPGESSCAPWALYPKAGDNAIIEVFLQTEDLVFSDGSSSKALPESTRAHFREAMRRLEDLACVRFSEVSSPGSNWEHWGWRWGIMVGKMVGHEDYCYMSTTGVPGRMSFINLGWCDSEAYIGSMVHEILHALGMNHEMKRPDAWVTYKDMSGEDHGPYLAMKAGGLPTDSQLQPDENTYVGSSDVGWAGYDFDSIMHYSSWGSEWQTIPAGANDHRTGQRSHPSEGDIKQLMDFYRCPAPDTTAAATTTQGVATYAPSGTAIIVKAFAGSARPTLLMQLLAVAPARLALLDAYRGACA